MLTHHVKQTGIRMQPYITVKQHFQSPAEWIQSNANIKSFQSGCMHRNQRMFASDYCAY